MSEADWTVSKDSSNFEAFLTQFDAMLQSDPPEALKLVDGASDEIRAEGEWALCRADALCEVEGVEAAIDFLIQFVDEEPGHADAQHQLAGLCAAIRRDHDAIVHHLATLRLDADLDMVSESVDADLADAIVMIAEQTLQEMPTTLSGHLGVVPILLAARPSEDLVRGGLDARAFGTFEGSTLADIRNCNAPIEPAKITIFTGCLMQAFGLDADELLERVRRTVLQAVARFFGCDEQGLDALELNETSADDSATA